MKGSFTDTKQGILCSSLICRAAEWNLKGLTLFALAKATLAVSQLCLQLPFALAPMELLSPRQLFCQPTEVPSTDDISLLPVGCSYYSLDLLSSHFDLHFLLTCFFPNILMFFYLLRKLMQRLSCLASNYIPPLCLLPQFLLIAVSVFFPLSLVLQTTLWFVLFFFLSKDPHSYSYHL